MNLVKLMASLGVLCPLAMPAFALTPLIPLIEVSLDTTRFTLLPEPYFDENGKLKYGLNTRFGSENEHTLGVDMDPDPSIVSALGLVDFGAPSTFGFSWSLPIVPTLGPVQLKLTLAGTCTDSFSSNNGCSASTSLPSGFLAEGSLDGPSYVFGGGSFSGPAGGGGNLPSMVYTVNLPAAVVYSSLDMHLALTGSGGGDAFSFSLGVEVIPVPEVPTSLLMGLGLSLVVLLGRSRFLLKTPAS